MTAFTTCPFLIWPSGLASFTFAVMMSPMRPYRPAEPPRRLMQEIFRAPELSATSRMDRIWIMARLSTSFARLPGRPRSPAGLGGLVHLHAAGDDPRDAPPLAGRQRPAFHDLDGVPDPALAPLVVRHEA